MISMIASIDIASGKSYCRGECKYGTKIPAGTKCLRVMGCFYCEKCMKNVFDCFIKVMNDVDK